MIRQILAATGLWERIKKKKRKLQVFAPFHCFTKRPQFATAIHGIHEFTYASFEFMPIYIPTLFKQLLSNSRRWEKRVEICRTRNGLCLFFSNRVSRSEEEEVAAKLLWRELSCEAPQICILSGTDEHLLIKMTATHSIGANETLFLFLFPFLFNYFLLVFEKISAKGCAQFVASLCFCMVGKPFWILWKCRLH